MTTDDSTNGLDAVGEGPVPSDAVEAPEPSQAPDTSDHPTVTALLERFGDAVRHHEVVAGDEHVVFVDPARNLDVLGWLKDDPSADYAFLTDVTAVDYGGGRPLQVVYQLFSLTWNLYHIIRRPAPDHWEKNG